MRPNIILAVFGIICICNGEVPFVGEFLGYTTYFATGGVGQCNYETSDFNQTALFVTAVGGVQFAEAIHCGECLYVETTEPGVNRSVVVTIVDRAPGLGVGNLSMSNYAFEQLGGVGFVPIAIKWRSVPCPTVGGLVVKTASQDGYYLEFIVKNSKLPIQNVEVKVNGIYRNMAFKNYNSWVLSTGINVKGPFNIRITDVYGEQITGTMPTFIPHSNQCIEQQFSDTNPTTGGTTGDFLPRQYCNASNYPVGMTTDGNTGIVTGDPNVATATGNVATSTGIASATASGISSTTGMIFTADAIKTHISILTGALALAYLIL